MIELSESSRVILYYNGAISALTLFLQHPDESVCSPSPLPALSSVLEEGEMPLTIALMAPADMASAISNIMGLPADLLQANMGYREQVDTPGGIITVYLAYFNVLDPPRQLMAEKPNSKGLCRKTSTEFCHGALVFLRKKRQVSRV